MKQSHKQGLEGEKVDLDEGQIRATALWFKFYLDIVTLDNFCLVVVILNKVG
jgi:hypothetical protein